MLKKARSILKQKDKKLIFSNFLSLSFMQAANYIIPLIAIPYLVRVLGDDRFGLVMFAQAFIQYFIILVDFGFELSATREISIHRENQKKVTEIFSSVMYVKFALMLASLLIMSVIVFSFEHFRQEWQLYFLTFGMVVGQMLFPVWYFQGKERMKYVMYFNLLAKTVFTVLIFFTIFSPADYKMYAVVNSGGFLLAGLIAFLVALYMNGFRFVQPSFVAIKSVIVKTRDVFISNVGISLYLTSTAFILGIVTGRNDLVGFYSVAEKAVRGIRYVISPITQALFPYLSKRFSSEGKKESLVVIKKLLIYLSPVLLIILACIVIFANKITWILTGSENAKTILDMQVLSAILFVGTFNNVLGVLGMINMGMERNFRNSVVICGIFNIASCLVSSYFLLDLGASISIVATETLLMILLILKMRKEYSNA